MYPEAEAVIDSRLCQGYSYIEEGQQTYYQAKEFSAENNRWATRKLKIMSGSVDHYFRDDYQACIGLSDESFPLLQADKKFVVRDFQGVKALYTPQLVGVTDIGLMPAPRRVPEGCLENIAKQFVSEMPDGGVVKLHPGYNAHSHMKEKFIEEIEKVSEGKIICCPDTVNLELEMMYEPKVFIGARSSVSRYSEIFGSEYRFIEFDGYILPNN
jgi:hypothetical protein